MGYFHRVCGPTRWGMRGTAAQTSLVLSLLFLVVYGSCNWITAQRTNVGT